MSSHISPQFEAGLTALMAEVNSWMPVADSLVEAWHARRPAAIEHRHWTFSSDGVSIFMDAECVLTRPPHSLVNALAMKRFPAGGNAARFYSFLKQALEKRQIAFAAVSFPYASDYDRTLLLKAWEIHLEAISPNYQARFSEIAHALVHAWTNGEEKCIGFNYTEYSLSGGKITVDAECVAVEVARPPLAVISARKYLRGSTRQRFRDELIDAFTRAGVRIFRVRPEMANRLRAEKEDLIRAWERSGPHLV